MVDEHTVTLASKNRQALSLLGLACLIFVLGTHSVAAGEPEVFYVHTDHLGTPQAITDDTQSIVWQADYTPFGSTINRTDVVKNHLRFPGQYFDRETGLHYNKFRDYDATLGRYVQSDPIGLQGGINPYRYASSNPIKNIDPYGLVRWEGQVSGLALLTFGYFVFELRSECVNGKRGYAKVYFAGPGLGVGAVDFAFSQSNVSLKDPLELVDPQVFNDSSLEGGFIASAAAALGQRPEHRLGQVLGGGSGVADGYGCAAIRLGAAGGKGCGEIFGIDIGVGAFFGSSTVDVLESRTENCECGSK